MMKRLVVNPGKTVKVYGHTLQAGEEFEVPDVDAVRWKAFQFASDAPERKGPGRPRHYLTREGVQRGRYQREDMRAEDESSHS